MQSGVALKINSIYICGRRWKYGYMAGAVAQLVEQWTENPCVGGSIPPHTTKKLECMAFELFYCPSPSSGSCFTR